MSAIQDHEIAAWTADWRGAPEPAPPLAAIRRRARGRTLGLALLTLVEVLFSAALLVFLARFAFAHPTPVDIATMSAFSLLILYALAFALWNRRSVWRPATHSTSAYLALSITRCRRRLRTVRCGYVLLAAETLLFIPWIAYHQATGERLLSWLSAYGFLALMVATVLTALLLIARHTRHELTTLLDLQERLR